MEPSWRSSRSATTTEAQRAKRRLGRLQVAGYSQRQIGAAAGLNASTVSRLTSGRQQMTRVTAKAILSAKPRFSL